MVVSPARWFGFLGILCLLIPVTSQAVETAPRITDREIIEGLSDLKGRSRQLEIKMDERFDAVNQRFESFQSKMDERFDTVNQRFESLESKMDARFESIEDQFGHIWGLMLVIIAGIFGLIGFIVWDRRTVLKPVEQRLDRMESYLEYDLEIRHDEGSRLTRLVKVLREMAREDERLAAVLRSFSLM